MLFIFLKALIYQIKTQLHCVCSIVAHACVQYVHVYVHVHCVCICSVIWSSYNNILCVCVRVCARQCFGVYLCVFF